MELRGHRASKKKVGLVHPKLNETLQGGNPPASCKWNTYGTTKVNTVTRWTPYQWSLHRWILYALCTAIQGLLSTRCHTLLYRGFAWFCWNAKTEEILNKELFHRDPLLFRIAVLHSAKVFFCCCIFCCRCSEVVELTWMNKVWSLEIPKKLLYLICFPSDNQAETCQTAPEVQLEKSRMSNTPHRSWVFRRLSRFCFLDICMIDWMVYELYVYHISSAHTDVYHHALNIFNMFDIYGSWGWWKIIGTLHIPKCVKFKNPPKSPNNHWVDTVCHVFSWRKCW